MPRLTPPRIRPRDWDCDDCDYAHRPGSVCPRPGIWLIANMCPTCTTTRYCSLHDMRRK